MTKGRVALSESSISPLLIGKRYVLLNSNVPNVQFYLKRENNEVYIVGIINDISKFPISSDQLDDISRQLENNFLLKGYSNVKIIYIAYSRNLDRAKSYAMGKYPIWFIDNYEGRLIIFENQPEEFDGIREQLESVVTDLWKKQFEKEKIDFRKLPFITIALIVINVISFIYLESRGSTLNARYMLDKGALFYVSVFEDKEIYRLITSMFMHFGVIHLGNNMMCLALIGDKAESYFGHIRYLLIYFLSGIFAGTGSIFYYSMFKTITVSAGASGAIYGIMGAVVVKIIEEKKNKKNDFGKIVLVLLLLIVAGRNQGNVDNVAHLAGFAAGIVLGIINYLSINLSSKRNKYVENK